MSFFFYFLLFYFLLRFLSRKAALANNSSSSTTRSARLERFFSCISTLTAYFLPLARFTAARTSLGDTKDGFSKRVAPPKDPAKTLIRDKQQRGPTSTSVVLSWTLVCPFSSPTVTYED